MSGGWEIGVDQGPCGHRRRCYPLGEDKTHMTYATRNTLSSLRLFEGQLARLARKRTYGLGLLYAKSLKIPTTLFLDSPRSDSIPQRRQRRHLQHITKGRSPQQAVEIHDPFHRKLCGLLACWGNLKPCRSRRSRALPSNSLASLRSL